MSGPIVPPRPSRTAASTSKDSMPEVPPRPFRKLEPSPSRDSTRSPLNELPAFMTKNRPPQNNLSAPEVPPRPSMQNIPSVGQEGNEYASFDQLPEDAHGVQVDAPEQTRNVAENMPLHAPKASLAQSAAKSRIETVTGTDSTQAAAMGIGRAKPADDVHKIPTDGSSPLTRAPTKPEDLRRVPSADPHLRSSSSFNRSPSLHPTSRPGSMYNEGGHEHGIPEIGMQIPLNPNAGDVQAPSPAPAQSQFPAGIGFFNDGSARAHHRKRSSRHEFGPPGSFGLHSHGQEPSDQFEREWIAKNPDRAAMEGSTAYGTEKPETALSSAQLNKLVNQSSDVGMGTSPNMIGTPGEEIAWGATDEYTARWTSPKPSPLPTSERKKRTSSETHAQSPLRKTSFAHAERSTSSEAVDDDGVIHVEPLERSWNRYTGGGAADNTLDLGPRGGNTEERGGWFDEQGHGTPILASDEVVKRPGSAFMQPAIGPEAHDDYDSDTSHGNSRRNSMRVPSRPSSRPSSVHGEYHGGNLHRFISHEEHHGSGLHTPLEEIEEYEPLIPEGEEESPKPKPQFKKRPGLEHYHFPSQDIWEDTPSSLQYQTTVDTPEPAAEARSAPPPSSKTSVFETPEQEQRRKAQNPDDIFSDNKTFIKPALRDEMRPGMHRFPSQDVWEDTPDSMRVVTTVSGPQMEEVRSPPEDRPTTTGQDEGDVRATTGWTQTRRPSVPARPHRKSKLAEEIKPEGLDEATQSASRDIPAEKLPSPDKSKPPTIPDRPKPSVPARPARSSREAQADGTELSKSISPEDGLPAAKTKPAVPARPGGEKIAALKAGFMSDLNNRLKLGPQGAPQKTQEADPEVAEETTKAPLADARKGRAKGPTRRKPASSPSATAEPPALFSISTTSTVWETDESNNVQVPSVTVTDADANESALPKLEAEMAANEAHNTSEPTLGEPMSPEKVMSPPPTEFAAADAMASEAMPTSVPVERKDLAPQTSEGGPADLTAVTADHALAEDQRPVVVEEEAKL